MNYKHGHSGKKARSNTWIAHRSMKSRCLRKTDENYKNYGGRGISVCDRWMKFENFLADMGVKPEGKSIDRIDNNGNYEPSNCRWATPIEQAGNRKTTRLFTYNGKTQCLARWANDIGACKNTVYTRIKNGMSIEDAITKPPQTRKGKQ